MKNLSNYEINEALNCLCELSDRIKYDYLHVSNVMATELKYIDSKIAKLYKELEKRQTLNN